MPRRPTPGATRRELDVARALYAQRRWAEAYEALRRAARDEGLEGEDLERLVWAAALCGDDDGFLGALEELHRACAAARDWRRAAHAAFWLGFRLQGLGRAARAAGWLARARRHVDAAGGDCAEQGYLLLPEIHAQLGADDAAAAGATAHEAAAIGERCRDPDLVAVARGLEARAELRQGRREAGLALLDEAMLAATAGELSPFATGLVYCNAIATCQQVFALGRAREWTAALAGWCEQQPQLVNFTGNCVVHRAEILQLAGDWPAAHCQLGRAIDGAGKDDADVLGDAYYVRAELHRLRGELAEAEVAFRLASRHGHDPQPGLALLRLAQGRRDEAVRAIERVAMTATSPWQRPHVLPALVEIMIAAGRVDRARAACDELDELAGRMGIEVVAALAAQARGALCLADGDPRAAIVPLRRAFGWWHAAGAPHLAARTRALLGRAFRALGDLDGAALELDAAREVFARLGAAPDLAALDAEAGRAGPADPHGLSRREREVLRLVARGKSNKEIARDLFVSERTIDRHVSNILARLRVPSRAAATAFAYEHGLV